MKKKNLSAPAAIYLHQNADASWSASIFTSVPGQDSIKLCEERFYPADLFYERQDMNGSSVVDRFVCKDRRELLDNLNWIGQCHSIVRSLWDFDFLNDMDPKVYNIFAAAWQKKFELISQEWDDLARSDAKDFMKALEADYKDFFIVDDLVGFSSQELNIDLVGCVKAILQPSNANVLAKFVLQHMHHYVSFCDEIGNKAALSEMEQLLTDLSCKYSSALEPEVLSACAYLSEMKLSQFFGKPSLDTKLRTAAARADKSSSQNTLTGPNLQAER